MRPKSTTETASHPSITAGHLFEVHPSIAKSFSLPARAAAALIDLQPILKSALKPTVPVSVPLFPAVSYDVTLPLSHREQAGEIIKRLRQEADPLLEGVEPIDVYSSDPSSDQYSLTLRFTYRASERTLTEEEARPVHEKTIQGLGTKE